MSRNYEALLVLDTREKEDSVDDIISGLGKEMEAAGAQLEQIDHVGKHKFPYNAQHLDEGYYVSFKFAGEPTIVADLRQKLALNKDVHLQHYQRA